MSIETLALLTFAVFLFCWAVVMERMNKAERIENCDCDRCCMRFDCDAMLDEKPNGVESGKGAKFSLNKGTEDCPIWIPVDEPAITPTDAQELAEYLHGRKMEDTQR